MLGWGLDFDWTIVTRSCCKFAGVLGIIVLLHEPLSAKLNRTDRCMSHFQPSLTGRTDGLTFDLRILWYIQRSSWSTWLSCGSKQAQTIIRLPSAYLTVGLSCLCWYAVFSFFHQMWHCTLWPNISTMVSSDQMTLFQKSWGLFRCNFRT